MERDPHESFEAPGSQTPQPTAFGTGSPSPRAQGELAGALGAEPSREGGTEQGIDTAKQKVNQVADKAKQKASAAAEQAKEKATQLKVTLADKLDAGADKLRQKTTHATDELQQSTSSDGTTAQATQTMDRVGGAVATGMEKTANWLRTADLDTMRTDIEHQVRQNPGRSLVVALGLGYVLGRMFRSRTEG